MNPPAKNADPASGLVPRSPSEPPTVMDYASPVKRPLQRVGRLLVLLMPVWCGVILVAALFLNGPLWVAAMGFPLFVALGCAARRRWALACYSFAWALAVFAFLLPSLNRAR